MYEKHNTQNNTIESILNIHERYWAFFKKFPMDKYLLDFDFETQDLKDNYSVLICTAKLIDRADEKVLLKTVSSIDINAQFAWQYVESYAAARLFNRLSIEVKLEELDKPLSTHQPNTSNPTINQNSSDHVDLDLPQIGELIPNETSQQPSVEVEPSSEISSVEPESLSASAAKEEGQSEVNTTAEQSVETLAEDDSSNTELSDDGETESTVEVTAAEVETEVVDELDEAEVSEIETVHHDEVEPEQATPESDVNLNATDLEEVSIALPTADMFGEDPVDTSDTSGTAIEAEVEQEQSFDMLEEVCDEPTQEETTEAEAEVAQPAIQHPYDETNHPQDVPGTIWGNVVAAVKEMHGNEWKAHLPTNMEEAIVILQSS